MRDYLPILERKLPPTTPNSPTTGHFISPRTWETGTARSLPFVLLAFDDQVPLGLSPDEARALAEELVEHAETVDNRSRTAH